MMHKKNFVAAIKVDGKVLRESSDRVQLPFGSEYSVLLKNLDTVRMQAQISIDGQDATGWLVIDPGASVDVERFYRQNRDHGNRFKFIERTERIEKHRGVGAEDGLVRVEFRREKVYENPQIVEHHTYHRHSWPYLYPRTYPWPYYNTNFCGTLTQNQQSSGERSLVSKSGVFGASSSGLSKEATSGSTTRSSSSNSQSIATMNYSGPIYNAMGERGSLKMAAQNEAGITVDGSISDQRFTPVAGFECEASEVIVLHLVGRKGTALISVARTVEHRLTCEICGKRNLPTAKFCIECGTSLEKV
jgi:hypothetical protein